MNEIQPYAFRGNDVRVVVVDEEPWFVASDVAKVLGYREAYYLTRGLDDEDKGPHIVRTPQVRITPAGLERLRELLEPERSLALVGDDFPA